MEQYLGLEQERSMLKLQRNFYKYVIDFLASEQSYSGLSLPALSGIEDPLVGALSTELLEISVELEQFKYTLSEENPAIAELEEQPIYQTEFGERDQECPNRTRIVQKKTSTLECLKPFKLLNFLLPNSNYSKSSASMRLLAVSLNYYSKKSGSRDSTSL